MSVTIEMRFLENRFPYYSIRKQGKGGSGNSPNNTINADKFFFIRWILTYK